MFRNVEQNGDKRDLEKSGNWQKLSCLQNVMKLAQTKTLKNLSYQLKFWETFRNDNLGIWYA